MAFADDLINGIVTGAALSFALHIVERFILRGVASLEGEYYYG